jgi:CO dehydrogenase flavoprotein C-terminal domain.
MFYRQWNEKMLEEAYSALMEDLTLPPDAPGGMIQYRRSLSLRYILDTFYEMGITRDSMAVCLDFWKQFVSYSCFIIACVSYWMNTLQ